jgi:hypothetical protein
MVLGADGSDELQPELDLLRVANPPAQVQGLSKDRAKGIATEIRRTVVRGP